MGDQPILPGFRFENAQVSNCRTIQNSEHWRTVLTDFILLLFILVAGKRFSPESTIYGDQRLQYSEIKLERITRCGMRTFPETEQWLSALQSAS